MPIERPSLSPDSPRASKPPKEVQTEAQRSEILEALKMPPLPRGRIDHLMIAPDSEKLTPSCDWKVTEFNARRLSVEVSLHNIPFPSHLTQLHHRTKSFTVDLMQLHRKPLRETVARRLVATIHTMLMTVSAERIAHWELGKNNSVFRNKPDLEVRRLAGTSRSELRSAALQIVAALPVMH